jgi:HAD superfamily hydrolase (TIGR01509 family)
LLRAARDAKWVTAVVTSNAENLVRAWLTRNGLGELVDFVVDGVAGGRGKPYPDPYLIALELGAASAPHSVAVEDSQQGVRAALAAKLPTYVLSARRREAHETNEASRTPGIAGVITSLAELTVVLR